MLSAVRFKSISVKILAMTLAIFAAPSFCAWAGDGAPAVVVGDIAVVTGAVFLTPSTGVKTPHKAEAGGTVSAGDIVSTGKDGQIKMLMKDRTVLDLGPSSRITVQNFKMDADGQGRQVDLSLDHGMVRTLVSKKVGVGSRFVIRTKTATMGVRGTEFVVEAVNAGVKGISPKTSVSVLQGQVSLERVDATQKATQSPILLPAGTQLTLRPGDYGAAKPIVMVPAVLAAISPQAVVRDHGVDNAIKVEKSGGMASGMDIPQKSGRTPASDDLATHAPTAPVVVPGAFAAGQILAPPPINTFAGKGSHGIQVTVVHP